MISCFAAPSHKQLYPTVLVVLVIDSLAQACRHAACLRTVHLEAVEALAVDTDDGTLAYERRRQGQTIDKGEKLDGVPEKEPRFQ